MDARFSPHNTHLEDPDLFFKRDPNLKELQKQLLVHRSCLLDKLPQHQPGIYTIVGGRQVGKTTLMKQWMADLLKRGVAPGDKVDQTTQAERPQTNCQVP